jgi:DNA primase
MAAGIPQETIELVRAQADIVQVISEYLTLKKAGANYKACCPFHSEKTPSFMVSPSKQIFYCFGCGTGGNVFAFLMRQEGLSFPEAVRRMAERLGIEIKLSESDAGQKQLREQLLDLCEFAGRFYHRCLLKAPEAEHARKYLAGRSLNEDALKAFSIGYAPGGWDTFLKAALKKGFKEDLLIQSGLAKKGEGKTYDAFRNRVMFPIHDTWGKLVAFGGRALEENVPKYINSPETPIYHKGETLYNIHRAKKAMSSNGSAIVVEGYTDLIRLALNGVENVVASLGTAFTQAQARLIKRYAPEVVLVFDSDAAGISAAGRGVEVLLSEDLRVRVAVVPSGKDPDEFVLMSGADAFVRVLETASNFIEFHLDKALAGKNPNDIESKASVANTLANLVGRIPNPIRRQEYLRLVSGRMGIKPEFLLETSQKGNFADKLEKETISFQRKLQHEERECLWLVKLMVERPECVKIVRENLDVAAIQNEPLRQLFHTIFEFDAGSLSEAALLDRVQDEQAQQLLTSVIVHHGGTVMLYPPEWWAMFIRSRQGQEKLSAITKEIAEAERGGDSELLRELLKRKIELHRDMTRMRREMLKIPVDSQAGTHAGGEAII